MVGETKTARIDQKSTFFISLFFLKIQDIRKQKTPIFERGSHKYFLGQVLTIFQTSPTEKIIYPKIVKQNNVLRNRTL